MALTGVYSYLSSPSRIIKYIKDSGATGLTAGRAYTQFDIGGTPVNGTLAIGNITTGIVPVAGATWDSGNGYPPIPPLLGSTAKITEIRYSNSVVSRLILVDTLFSMGAFSFNSNVTGIVSPSWASRAPTVDDYNDLEIWFEAVTAFTGIPTIAIDVKDRDGAAVSGGAGVSIGYAPAIRNMVQLPNPSSKGISAVTKVTCTVATAGTFNIHIMRRLWQGQVKLASSDYVHNYMQLGLPTIYPTSALRVILVPAGTTAGIPDVEIEVPYA